VPAARNPYRRAASTLLVAANPTIAVVRATVDPVRSAKGEVHEVLVPRGDPAPGGLGGDRGLERDLVQEEGLDELGNGDGGRDLEERLVGEDDPALRHRPHFAAETKRPEPLDGLLVVAGFGREGPKVVLLETEALEERKAWLEPCGNQEPSARGEAPHEQAEGGLLVHPAAEVARGHVELVQVGEQRPAHVYRLREAPCPSAPAMQARS
jgi:hypothetical protein